MEMIRAEVFVLCNAMLLVMVLGLQIQIRRLRQCATRIMAAEEPSCCCAGAAECDT